MLVTKIRKRRSQQPRGDAISFFSLGAAFVGVR